MQRVGVQRVEGGLHSELGFALYVNELPELTAISPHDMFNTNDPIEAAEVLIESGCAFGGHGRGLLLFDVGWFVVTIRIARTTRGHLGGPHRRQGEDE